MMTEVIIALHQHHNFLGAKYCTLKKSAVMTDSFCIPFKNLRLTDLSKVGGKNASLGEMIHSLSTLGVLVPDGFATTVEAYKLFLSEANLETQLREVMNALDETDFSNLSTVGKNARNLLGNAKLPEKLIKHIADFYTELSRQGGIDSDVAVRSSATAEDLPDASFAGLHDSYLHITGIYNVLEAVKKCFISLFNDRAIKYRHDHGFGQMDVYLSAGIQRMVRSDLASSGVLFTLDPESGFKDVIQIAACWGIGENIVQGTITPDEYYIFKPSLSKNKIAILSRKLGSKSKTMIYGTGNQSNFVLVNVDTPTDLQKQFVLSDSEINLLANWALLIEKHYECPMDIEWAKDGVDGKLYIVQARPETVHSRTDPLCISEFTLSQKGRIIVKGSAVGKGISSGVARRIDSPADGWKLKTGEVLVTDLTNPDWDPILKKAAAIITNKGGRTSHAAIVAREVGTVAVVGTANATDLIKDGQMITVSCAEGRVGVVYDEKLSWSESKIDLRTVEGPVTSSMLILGDPDKAFALSFYPNNGVGLMRLEFIINTSVAIHPMALVKYPNLKSKKDLIQIEEMTSHYLSKKDYFIDKLSQAVATIAAAFYPKEVIVRMSDFKTNEYANLIGGAEFEPHEENPMIGFRGASRYYHEMYREGFRLECEAMIKVRNDMGLTNVKLMIPFCRTVEEGKKVIALMDDYGLKRGLDGLEIYVMAEIPSNILDATEFAAIFDGFSIGSNDLTQLTLGLDRDSQILSGIFDENNSAVKKLISSIIRDAHQAGIKVGLCGQAPSDFPEFAQFLVEQGIDSISFNPDALLKGMQNMVLAEKRLSKKHITS